MSFRCYFGVLLFAWVPAFWGEPGECLRVAICVGSAFCGRLLLAICLGSCPLGRGQPCLMLRPLLVLLLLLLLLLLGQRAATASLCCCFLAVAAVSRYPLVVGVPAHASVVDDLTRQILCWSADTTTDVQGKGGGGAGTSCAEN